MKKLILLLAIIGANFAHAQCTNVCIKGGSVAITGSTVINPAGNYTLATTYSFVTSAGVNSITAGALSVSVSNVGDSDALFNATTLPAGMTINLLVPNAKLPAFTYNCQTSTLTVLVNR